MTELGTYASAFINATLGTVQWVWRLIILDVPWYTNMFWGLVVISLFVWMLEIVFPWRKYQPVFRKDFWLDAGYMFFNFFLFTIAISGVYEVMQLGFKSLGVTMQSIALFNPSAWPMWLQLVVFFVVLDFVQWFTHILLHRYPLFWRFHKVHHSVKEMGFAAHLRFHWMENLLYKPLKTLGVMILFGFEPAQAYIIHFIAITIGHFNHANIKITWGPLKYLLNNPVMHLYHHAHDLPKGRYGVNYAISLSLWDYIFRTTYIPEDSGTIELGFPGDENFPDDFIGQNTYGFKKEEE